MDRPVTVQAGEMIITTGGAPREEFHGVWVGRLAPGPLGRADIYKEIKEELQSAQFFLRRR